MAKITAFITPTTHWDREWLMPLGQFQVRLVNMMDHLLDIMARHPEYRFLFDGQAIALKDYLEIRPEQRESMSAFLRSGQLVAGPWYVLADQFLENGESTIRNLMTGMRMIEQLGGRPMMLGYVPDSFGSIAALPMILEGFNIHYATFGRGRSVWGKALPHTEFYWESADGSRVLAANHGYGNAMFLSYLDIWADIFSPASCNLDPEAVMARFIADARGQQAAAAGANLYFSVGCDQMEARENLPGLLHYINEHQDEYELVFGMPEDYLRGVERDAVALHRYRGEMRGMEEPKHFMDLVGTLSSRMPLKQANDACELLLQRQIEPLWSMLATLVGSSYPTGHLRKMWTLLLSNHPHDSICGCSIDQVHADMANRFAQIQSIGSYLLKDGLHQLLAGISTGSVNAGAVALTIVNPLGDDYSGPVSGIVRVPRRFHYDAYTLVDAVGKVIPARVRHITDKWKDLESVYMTNEQLTILRTKDATAEKPDDQIFTMLEVDLLAAGVPGIGYQTLWLQPGMVDPLQQPMVVVHEHGMENEWLIVTFDDDGTLSIEDKRNGYRYNGLNYFVDREDVGSSYDYHGFPTPSEVDSRTSPMQWSVSSLAQHRVTFTGAIAWELPAELAGGKRSARLLQETLTVSVTQYAGVPRLDIVVELDNVCTDHCLRVAFDTEMPTDIVSVYDHFTVIERKVLPRELEWRDEPFQEFVDVSDGRHGLSIFTKGLPAYEAVQGENGTRLYLTLLRAVGRLYHSEGAVAGVTYPVPAAQCPGHHRCEYAIMPHSGNWVEGACLRNAVAYRSPLLLEAELPHDGHLPPTGALLSVRSWGAVKPYLSALKPAEDGNGLILRLWNPAESETIQLDSSFSIKTVTLLNLAEATLDPTNLVGSGVPLKGHGLTTLRIVFAEGD